MTHNIHKLWLTLGLILAVFALNSCKEEGVNNVPFCDKEGLSEAEKSACGDGKENWGAKVYDGQNLVKADATSQSTGTEDEKILMLCNCVAWGEYAVHGKLGSDAQVDEAYASCPAELKALAFDRYLPSLNEPAEPAAPAAPQVGDETELGVPTEDGEIPDLGDSGVPEATTEVQAKPPVSQGNVVATTSATLRSMNAFSQGCVLGANQRRSDVQAAKTREAQQKKRVDFCRGARCY